MSFSFFLKFSTNLTQFLGCQSTDVPIPAYGTLRTWRLLDLAAPSLRLNMTLNIYDLPFSVKVEGVVGRRELMKFMGDYYQGTEFDLTMGWRFVTIVHTI